MKKVAAVFLVMLVFTPISNCLAEGFPKPPEESREEIYHDLFITLLSPNIDVAVNEYYSKLLTTNPTVYGYMVDILGAERVYGYRSFRFLVTLEVTPVVGPHISVGKDRLVFDIGAGGTKLIKYEHLETHELPDHWKDILKTR